MSHTSGAISSFFSFLWDKLKNFIYPEVVNTDLLENLRSSNNQKANLKNLRRQSELHLHKTKLTNYINTHKKPYKSFLEHTCPVCKDDISDGAIVVELNCKHFYHADCLHEHFESDADDSKFNQKRN